MRVWLKVSGRDLYKGRTDGQYVGYKLMYRFPSQDAHLIARGRFNQWLLAALLFLYGLPADLRWALFAAGFWDIPNGGAYEWRYLTPFFWRTRAKRLPCYFSLRRR